MTLSPVVKFSKMPIARHGASGAERRLTTSVNSNGKNGHEYLDLRGPCANCASSVRYQVSSSQAINYSEEASRLANIINSYSIE
jgi:hypothetical protein